jgi:hypothetical protein
MTAIRSILGAFLIGFFLSGNLSMANPPEKKTIWQKIENSFLFNSATRWAVREYSEDLLEMNRVDISTEDGKQAIIDSSSLGTVGIILYEFATGEGPASRYFYKSDPFTQEVLRTPGLYYTLNQFASACDSSINTQFDSGFHVNNIRYQFSPVLVPIRPSTWQFSVEQHLATLEARTLSQVLLGSFNTDIHVLNDSTIRLHIWNRTSKKSLFGGFGKRLQRPLWLGTVEQHIVFELSFEEFDAIRRNEVFL